jgi:hypothetical protein
MASKKIIILDFLDRCPFLLIPDDLPNELVVFAIPWYHPATHRVFVQFGEIKVFYMSTKVDLSCRYIFTGKGMSGWRSQKPCLFRSCTI